MKTRYLLAVLTLLLVVMAVGCGKKTETTTTGTPGAKPVTTASTPKDGAETTNAVETAKPSVKTPTSFSADMVATTPAGKQTSKMAVDGKDKCRMEAMGQIIILRRDKGKMWMLNPSSKTAMEMPINEEMVKDMDKAQVDISKLKSVGEETVDGYLCDKYVVTDKSTTATTWVAKKIGLPVKIESAAATIQFQNIKVGAQPASLFEIDPGYKTTQMPDMSDMGKNMPKGVKMPSVPQ